MKRQRTQINQSRARFQRILVPIDFTDSGIRAVEFAADLARPMGATVTLMHVVESDQPEARHTAEEKLRNFARLFVSHAKTEFVVGAGELIEQILGETQESQPVFIVMTQRKRGAPRRFWRRDTTAEVMKRCSSAVLVLRDVQPELGDLVLI